MKQLNGPVVLKDLAAQVFLSLDFMAQFVSSLHAVPEASIKSFYHAFLQKNAVQHPPGTNVIFTPGLVLGALYVLVLLPEQLFYETIPTTPLETLSFSKWGRIEPRRCSQQDRNLRAVLRRIRNAIAHGHVAVSKDFSVTCYDDCKGSGLYGFEMVLSFDDIRRLMEAVTQSWMSNQWN